MAASNDMVIEKGGRESSTTNNRMELKAAIVGLSSISPNAGDSVTVHADSSYVINGITKWVYGWQKNGWKTATKQPVVNEDLWRNLAALVLDYPVKITWKYVGGHVGIAGNERVDIIASNCAEGKPVAFYNGPRNLYTVDVLNLDHNIEKASAKTSSRSHSKAKAYSYISEVDGLVKTHKTWSECEARVRGKKARYKKAISQEEEKKIIQQFSNFHG